MPIFDCDSHGQFVSPRGETVGDCPHCEPPTKGKFMFNLQEYLTEVERDYTALYWAKLTIANIVSHRPVATLSEIWKRQNQIASLLNDSRVYAELAENTRLRLGLPRS